VIRQSPGSSRMISPVSSTIQPARSSDKRAEIDVPLIVSADRPLTTGFKSYGGGALDLQQGQKIGKRIRSHVDSFSYSVGKVAVVTPRR